MKSLIAKLFKKEPDFSYTVAEYLPVKDRFRTNVSVTEYQLGQTANHASKADDMSIDKLYQRS